MEWEVQVGPHATHHQESPALHDPVCGMAVSSTSVHNMTHDGVSFQFCSEGCLTQFRASPEKFLYADLTPMESENALNQRGGHFICPMCPGIAQNEPGICPKCGMALQGTRLSLDDDDNTELINMTRSFLVSAIFCAPLILITMGELVPGLSLQWLGSVRLQTWIQLLLAAPVVLWCAAPLFLRGWQSLVSHHLNMFTLIALGTGVAFLYSLVATITPQIFPITFQSESGDVPVYFEAAAVIVTLVLLGQVLELRARSRAGSAIKALLGLAPKTARRIDEDTRESDIPLDQVKVGDRLRIRPGESVPVDGKVLLGDSRVDESMINGEPTPTAKCTTHRTQFLHAGNTNFLTLHISILSIDIDNINC